MDAEKRFLVRWEIDAWAETPEQAAEQAWEAMRRPDSTATAFTVQQVFEHPDGTITPGDVLHIDLMPEA